MNSPAAKDKATGARPFVAKGIKFYLPEWAIVSELQRMTGKNYTDLIKEALGDYALKKGLHWPES